MLPPVPRPDKWHSPDVPASTRCVRGTPAARSGLSSYPAHPQRRGLQTNTFATLHQSQQSVQLIIVNGVIAIQQTLHRLCRQNRRHVLRQVRQLL